MWVGYNKATQGNKQGLKYGRLTLHFPRVGIAVESPQLPTAIA